MKNCQEIYQDLSDKHQWKVISTQRAFCGPLRPIKLEDDILNVIYETRCLGVHYTLSALLEQLLGAPLQIPALERK